ncbi:hypothetical protein [Mesorhizobium sp.]|uniref:hypothetical protein n=1 Tax=Mesorhizobium sp. TaxID=1871066 RepID=UPI0025E2DCC3|nr:hypothetical protein [Mesorhizobium sp.]
MAGLKPSRSIWLFPLHFKGKDLATSGMCHSSAVDASPIPAGQNVDLQVAIAKKKAAGLILIDIQPFREAKVLLDWAEIGSDTQGHVFLARDQRKDMKFAPQHLST